MKNNKWIVNIFLSLLIFLVFFFVNGAEDLSELVHRFNYFVELFKKYPNFIWWDLAIGLFVGIIFWFIKTYGTKADDSNKKWIIRSAVILIIVFLFIYAVIRILDFFANI